jgi:hypothetical protein
MLCERHVMRCERHVMPSERQHIGGTTLGTKIRQPGIVRECRNVDVIRVIHLVSVVDDVTLKRRHA